MVLIEGNDDPQERGHWGDRAIRDSGRLKTCDW
jgi:hypothetical protein